MAAVYVWVGMHTRSPGPGCPTDFNTDATLELLLHRNIPIFGVCLGLQSMVQYFGGKYLITTVPLLAGVRC